MNLPHRLILAVLLSLPGIAPPGSAPAATPEPLPRPDLSRLAADVRAVLERTRRELERAIDDPAADPGQLALRYGSSGLFYHAHLLLEPAAACYRNASRLDPDDRRWPYYLGYDREQAGDLAGAAEAYTRALTLDPALDSAALRLGGVYLELGETSRAAPLLRRAARVPALAAAAEFGLGRLACSRGDWPAAVQSLERALAAAPEAGQVHYTLGLAYRGLGELARAREHLARRGEGVPGFPDPLVEHLESLSTGRRMLFHSGMDAAHRDDYPTAVRLFREGLAGDPDNRHARVSLARFLYLNGDTRAAREQLAQALAGGKGPALGRFLLALLLREAGRTRDAREQLEALLAQDPIHPGAHFYLAGLLWRDGDFSAAARHYGAVLETVPDHAEAAQWQVLAAILAGQGAASVRGLLEAELERDPQDPMARFFLASLLAAAPQEGVRDGPRALDLARGLHDAHPSPEHAELLAMALAETGDFKAAIEVQNGPLALALGRMRPDLVERLEAELESYREERPWRTPWDAEALALLRPPGNPARVFRDYPTDSPF